MLFIFCSNKPPASIFFDLIPERRYFIELNFRKPICIVLVFIISEMLTCLSRTASALWRSWQQMLTTWPIADRRHRGPSSFSIPFKLKAQRRQRSGRYLENRLSLGCLLHYLHSAIPNDGPRFYLTLRSLRTKFAIQWCWQVQNMSSPALATKSMILVHTLKLKC